MLTNMHEEAKIFFFYAMFIALYTHHEVLVIDYLILDVLQSWPLGHSRQPFQNSVFFASFSVPSTVAEITVVTVVLLTITYSIFCHKIIKEI